MGAGGEKCTAPHFSAVATQRGSGYPTLRSLAIRGARYGRNFKDGGSGGRRRQCRSSTSRVTPHALLVANPRTPADRGWERGGKAQWQNGLLQPYGKLQGSPARRSCSLSALAKIRKNGERERERKGKSPCGDCVCLPTARFATGTGTGTCWWLYK